MTLDDVLQDLIQQLSFDGDKTISWEEAREWPDNTIDIFKNAGWIKPKSPAKSVVCPGCEENCFMPVHVPPAMQGKPVKAYVACDRRDDMGRIPIPPEMLQQWQVTENQMAQWMARELGLKGKPKKDKITQTVQIGDIQGKKQSGRLELVSKESISLQASSHSLPLVEAVYFQGEELQVDKNAIIKIIDRPPPSEKKGRYKPSDVRREARKLKTQARNKLLKKIYLELKRKHPDKSDNWCALKISNMSEFKKLKSETIRKNMKR